MVSSAVEILALVSFSLLIGLPAAASAESAAAPVPYTVLAGSSAAHDMAAVFEARGHGGALEFYMQNPAVVSLVDATISDYDLVGAASFDSISAAQYAGGLYPFVVDRDGIILAHGTDSSLVGTFPPPVANGVPTWERSLALIDAYGHAWRSYQFLNPATGEIEDKLSLHVQHDGHVFVSGYYPVDAAAYSIPSFATITKDGTLHINSRTASDAGEYAFKVVAVDVDGNEASVTVYLTATKQATYGTPRQQQNVGAAMHDIRCNEPLELYVRNGMTPVCLHSATYEILAGRGLDLEPAAGHAGIDSYMMIASQNVRRTLDGAIAAYDGSGGGQEGLDRLTGSYDGLYYPYVLDFDANIVAHGTRPGDLGPLDVEAVQSTRTVDEVGALLAGEGDELWTEHNAIHPLTGDIGRKHSLLVLHDGYIFGSGYYLKSSPDDIQTVRIGALVPPIDRPGGAGILRMLATSIAADDFNEYLEGKGAPWRLEVAVRHTHPGTDEPLEAMRSFNSDGISLVAGPSASSSVLMIKPYADENGMTLLSCCSTSPALAIEGDSIFRLAPDDTRQGSVIARLMEEDGRKLLIPVWRDDIWGAGLYLSAAKSFEEAGGAVDTSVGSYMPCNGDGCYDEAFSEMVPALSSTVQRYVDQGMYSTGEIGIVFAGFEETVGFMDMASGYDVLDDVRWFGSDSLAQHADIVSAGTAEFAETVRFGAAIFAVDATTDRYVHVRDRLAEHTDLEANVYAYSSYDAVWVLGLAIEAAGGQDDPILVREQIPAVAETHDPAIGTISLNSAGDSEKASYDIWVVADGGWTHAWVYSDETGFVDSAR